MKPRKTIGKPKKNRHKLKRRRKHVVSTSRNYLGKTVWQQREDLHIRSVKRASPCFSSSSMPLEQLRNTYSLFRLKQNTIAVLHLTKCSFYITGVQKIDSSNWLKHTTLENIWYSVHRNVQFQWQLQQKQLYQFSYILLSPENKARSHNDRSA